MCEAAGPKQGLDRLPQFLGCEDGGGAGVLEAMPAFVRAPRKPIAGAGVTPWAEAIAAEMTSDEQRAGPEDLAVMPYTSGTTGKPKGCMHTHRSVLATSTAMAHWCADTSETVALAVLPMFHVGGMQVMNATIQSGGTVVLLTRWDRECAARQIERAGVTSFTAITTMLVDFLSNPGLDRHDLSSLMWLGGGGRRCRRPWRGSSRPRSANLTSRATDSRRPWRPRT